MRARVARLRGEGVDVAGLDVGDPDLPTPPEIVARAVSALHDPRNLRYPSYGGLAELRAAMAGWYRRRFGVELDPDTQVLPLLGSKDGIAHLPLAVVDPGDVVLVPDPGYAVYTSGALMAGGEPHPMRLRPERGFLPDLGAVPDAVAARARLLWLNYPNNPTAAVAPPGFLDAAVAFCAEHGILLAHDAPYSEITFDGYRAPSLLQSPGALEVGIEFHSLSKTYNMTGWRVGMAVGGAEAIALLGQVKSNVDSGIFTVVQRAALAALEEPAEALTARNALLGIDVPRPRATFYLWAPVPGDGDSRAFATRLLEDAAVSVTPGIAFGPGGEGFFRVSLTAPDDRIDEACRRIRALAG
ncbi:MAG: aminotransferase class I/II-fold pyridoxal phosphate-dependent enzyme [Chloroflexi bacterium]|nr:MAG: aminotransferase class I/II-fold pyridoxal phosphate-dependent enzyme [Chloroflexota bacterium]